MTTSDFLRDVKIIQNKDGYRFSVDALLLYSFVTMPRVKNIADLGAGSGIIGLLLAKKYTAADVVLIELQAGLAIRAEENIGLNDLEGRAKIINADIKKIASLLSDIHTIQSRTEAMPDTPYGLMPDSFDLVVSNPPFRKTETGLLSIGDEKAIARHEIRLSLADLLQAASLLLKHHGRFSMVHLPERLSEIIRVMKDYALEPKRLRFVHSYPSTEAKMLLIEAAKGGKPGLKIEKPLFIYNEDGSYTDEMLGMYES